MEKKILALNFIKGLCFDFLTGAESSEEFCFIKSVTLSLVYNIQIYLINEDNSNLSLVGLYNAIDVIPIPEDSDPKMLEAFDQLKMDINDVITEMGT